MHNAFLYFLRGGPTFFSTWHCPPLAFSSHHVRLARGCTASTVALFHTHGRMSIHPGDWRLFQTHKRALPVVPRTAVTVAPRAMRVSLAELYPLHAGALTPGS